MVEDNLLIFFFANVYPTKQQKLMTQETTVALSRIFLTECTLLASFAKRVTLSLPNLLRLRFCCKK